MQGLSQQSGPQASGMHCMGKEAEGVSPGHVGVLAQP